MPHSSQTTELLDVALRGGAISFNLLVTYRLSRLAKAGPARAFGIVFCLAMTIYVTLTSPLLGGLLGPALPVAIAVAKLGSAFLWWFALSLFNDNFRWRWILIVPALLFMAIWLAGSLGQSDARVYAELAHQALVIVLLVHVLTLALASLRGDLVGERRRFAIALSILIPLTGLVTAIVEIGQIWQEKNAFLVHLQTGAMFVLSFVFCDWITAHGKEIFVLPSTPDRMGRIGERHLLPAEQIELKRIRALIEGGALLDPQTSVSYLARLANIPDHRLRKLVNEGMAYRNFRELVNDFRIEEAKRRLADPARVREQVLTTAFDLGYASLAPFNRAFRERTGKSPTEYRNEALGRLQPD